MDDSVSEIRGLSAEVLGTLMKCVGERAMSMYMEKIVDKLRSEKIREYCEKAAVFLVGGSTANVTTSNGASGGLAGVEPTSVAMLARTTTSSSSSSKVCHLFIRFVGTFHN